jgi:sec-independent protein translocase protein TatC
VPRIKPIDHEDRLSIVEHLDELRTRLIVCAFVLAIAFGLCFWQNHLLLDIANNPLPNGKTPITFSPTEPFVTTLKVSVYAGLLLSLPILLYQAYAFVLPALAPHEKRVILPFLLSVPFLFLAGVVFSYFVVVPAAAKFLLNFNDTKFNIQIRASEWYGFFLTTLMAVGLVFQAPLGILSLTRLGIVTPEQLAHNRRYAILIIAIIAMLLPGTDPVTMLLCMVPLLILFEAPVQLSKVIGRPPVPGPPDRPAPDSH